MIGGKQNWDPHLGFQNSKTEIGHFSSPLPPPKDATPTLLSHGYRKSSPAMVCKLPS